jgi:hypothetical protein
MPLFEGLFACAVFFLPAEDLGALGHDHRAEQVAVVGQELGRLRQVVGLDVQVGVALGGFAQVRREVRGGAIALGQLVGAEQEVGQRELDVLGEHVGLEMDAQVGHDRGSDRRGRDAVARPRHDRRGDEQHVVLIVGLERPFGPRFDHVGEFVVGVGAGRAEMVEGGVEGVFVLGTQETIHGVGEALVPEVVFGAAAGIGQAVGEPQELFGVARQSAATPESVTFHRGLSLFY